MGGLRAPPGGGGAALMVTPGAVTGLVEELRRRPRRAEGGRSARPRRPTSTDAGAARSRRSVRSRTTRGSPTRPTGPLLAVVEAPDTETAIELAVREARDAAVSIWARDLGAGRAGRAAAAVAGDVGRAARDRPHGGADADRAPRRPAPARVAGSVGAGHAASSRRSGPACGAANADRGSPRARGAPVARAAGVERARSFAQREEGAVRAGAPPQPAPPFSTHPSRTLGSLARIVVRRRDRTQRRDVEVDPAGIQSNV